MTKFIITLAMPPPATLNSLQADIRTGRHQKRNPLYSYDHRLPAYKTQPQNAWLHVCPHKSAYTWKKKFEKPHGQSISPNHCTREERRLLQKIKPSLPCYSQSTNQKPKAKKKYKGKESKRQGSLLRHEWIHNPRWSPRWPRNIITNCPHFA